MHTCNCANKGTCPPDSTRHAIRQSNKHSTVATYNKPPVGEPPPGPKNRGRWVSGLKAECDFRGYLEKLGHGATGWNGAVFAVLASGGASWCGIFSCCNRCCTLHIVYNVPWIDVDGGEASLSHINVWPSTHTGSVRILDAVRSAVRPVYPGRGLYGLVPIILGWSAILLAQPFGCRVRFPRFALGFMGVAACVTDGIARISPLEHVGDKRLPALIRWLMTEGEARPNGCIDVSRSLPLVVKPIPPCRTSFRLGR